MSEKPGGDQQTDSYDVIVIGAGPAGENAADHAIRGSDRTAVLVEQELVGGECSYYACMPSKALLRPLEVAATANHLQGIDKPVEVDPAGLLARRDAWVSRYDDAGQLQWADGAGLEVIRGRGRVVDERVVEVVDSAGAVRRLTARQAVVIATGSTATIPEPYAEVAPWTSRDATGVLEVPRRIAIVGGGVVACEAATWLRALGAEVTMLVRGERLLAQTEPFAGEAVLAGLQAAGVEVRLGARVDSVRRDRVADEPALGRPHGGPVRLGLAGDELEVDEVLVATGRKPATDDLGLEAYPAADWLFSVGDASGEAPLTHWGKYRARQLGARLRARAEGRPEPRRRTDAPVPQVVFTDPQVAWVGRTSATAEADGFEVTTRDAAYTSAAGAGLLRDDADGHARLVADAATGRLLGATFVGPEVAELLHSATVAVVGGLTLTQLEDAVPSYPTASEIWLRLLDQ